MLFCSHLFFLKFFPYKIQSHTQRSSWSSVYPAFTCRPLGLATQDSESLPNACTADTQRVLGKQQGATIFSYLSRVCFAWDMGSVRLEISICNCLEGKHISVPAGL